MSVPIVWTGDSGKRVSEVGFRHLLPADEFRIGCGDLPAFVVLEKIVALPMMISDSLKQDLHHLFGYFSEQTTIGLFLDACQVAD
ncbi:hypothetical protein [Burkholderia lata]|uniref:hypothetical protein n=1 Tax=Burkholderia lata (strain ATCC 17760 / DSM 23089 / LMG 22485 / NCIMB 9086 / R18194 / 383) TaxID=482957 RepID=UPI00399BDB8D